MAKKRLFAVGCISLVIIVAWITSWAKTYLTQPPPFEFISRNQETAWSGPNEGEQISLSNLKNNRGESPEVPANTLVLLSVTDPRCSICRASADMITQLRIEANAFNVKLVLVSFDPAIPNEMFFDFASSLRLSEDSYQWLGATQDVSLRLKQMVVPSHILIDEKGVVVRRFPGSSADKEVRMRLGKEIIREMLKAKMDVGWRSVVEGRRDQLQ